MAPTRYYTLRSIREHYEKETAWLGICAMISHNPQAVVPVRAAAPHGVPAVVACAPDGRAVMRATAGGRGGARTLRCFATRRQHGRSRGRSCCRVSIACVCGVGPAPAGVRWRPNFRPGVAVTVRCGPPCTRFCTVSRRASARSSGPSLWAGSRRRSPSGWRKSTICDLLQAACEISRAHICIVLSCVLEGKL